MTLEGALALYLIIGIVGTLMLALPNDRPATTAKLTSMSVVTAVCLWPVVALHFVAVMIPITIQRVVIQYQIWRLNRDKAKLEARLDAIRRNA